MNGVEIMEQMDRMTNGWWRPSPGSIYPLLEQLQQEKLVEKTADGRYQLTEAARSGPEWSRRRGLFGDMGPREPGDAVREIEFYVRYLEEVAQQSPAQVQSEAERLRGLVDRLTRLTQKSS